MVLKTKLAFREQHINFGTCEVQGQDCLCQIWKWNAPGSFVILGTLFPKQLWYSGSAQTKPGRALWMMRRAYTGVPLASRAQCVCLKILYFFFPLCHFELFFLK